MNPTSPFSGPLQCDSVLELAPAKLLLTHLPGRAHTDGQGQVWSRSLPQDLSALRRWGATTIICLCEDHELDAMGVPDYVSATQNHGLALIHLPIPDMSTPGPEFQSAWDRHFEELSSLLSHPSHTAIHCAAGLGRTGMISAMLLVQAGWSAPNAMHHIRSIRPGAIETAQQEAYVASCVPPR